MKKFQFLDCLVDFDENFREKKFSSDIYRIEQINVFRTKKLCFNDLFNLNVQSRVCSLEFVQIMGKRGRPPKKKVPPKPVQRSVILSSEEDEEKTKNETFNVSSSSQRQEPGNELNATNIDTSQDHSEEFDEKPTEKVTRNSNKKKIILTGARKKDDTSDDSDATEVYV